MRHPAPHSGHDHGICRAEEAAQQDVTDIVGDYEAAADVRRVTSAADPRCRGAPRPPPTGTAGVSRVARATDPRCRGAAPPPPPASSEAHRATRADQRRRSETQSLQRASDGAVCQNWRLVHQTAGVSPARGKQCLRCGKLGHFRAACSSVCVAT